MKTLFALEDFKEDNTEMNDLLVTDEEMEETASELADLNDKYQSIDNSIEAMISVSSSLESVAQQCTVTEPMANIARIGLEHVVGSRAIADGLIVSNEGGLYAGLNVHTTGEQFVGAIKYVIKKLMDMLKSIVKFVQKFCREVASKLKLTKLRTKKVKDTSKSIDSAMKTLADSSLLPLKKQPETTRRIMSMRKDHHSLQPVTLMPETFNGVDSVVIKIDGANMLANEDGVIEPGLIANQFSYLCASLKCVALDIKWRSAATHLDTHKMLNGGELAQALLPGRANEAELPPEDKNADFNRLTGKVDLTYQTVTKNFLPGLVMVYDSPKLGQFIKDNSSDTATVSKLITDYAGVKFVKMKNLSGNRSNGNAPLLKPDTINYFLDAMDDYIDSASMLNGYINTLSTRASEVAKLLSALSNNTDKPGSDEELKRLRATSLYYNRMHDNAVNALVVANRTKEAVLNYVTSSIQTYTELAEAYI